MKMKTECLNYGCGRKHRTPAAQRKCDEKAERAAKRELKAWQSATPYEQLRAAGLRPRDIL